MKTQSFMIKNRTQFPGGYIAKIQYLLALALFLGSLRLNAQTAVVDVTFGNKGKVVTSMGSKRVADAWAAAIQADGKIVAAGEATGNDSSSLTLARYNTNGSLDSTFGTGGRVFDSLFGNYDRSYNYGRALAIQPDGKIILAGRAGIPDSNYISFNYDFGLVRYNTNGSRDSSFGINGIVTTDFAGGNDQIFSLIILPGGKILAGGSMTQPNNFSYPAWAQYNPNGSLDSSFGTNGTIFYYLGESIHSIALQPDGKIIAAGEQYQYGGGLAIVVRLMQNGRLDSTFGYNGVVGFSAEKHNKALSVAIQKDSKITLAGVSTNPITSHSRAFLLRLNKDGKRDSTFGVAGLANNFEDKLNTTATSLQIQPDQKLLVGGEISDDLTYYSGDFLLVRYNTNGTLDSTFGKHGIISTDFDESADNSQASVLQSDGKIVLVGSSHYSILNGPDGFALARYDPNDFLYYNTIKGSVYLDKNKNGIKDAADPFVSNAAITTTKAGIDTLSILTSNGRFSADIDTGLYVTKAVLPYYTAVPASHITANATYFHTDSMSFALQAVAGKRDVAVSLVPVTVARPGFANQYKILYNNQGTDTAASGTIQLIKNSNLIFNAAAPSPTSVSGDTLSWSFSNFKPMDTATIFINLNVQAPPEVNVGDTLRSVASISSSATDLTPLDNTSTLVQSVVGSYDPNDKTESHAGRLQGAQVADGDYLQYTIRFQNTGTDTAFNVYIKDTLSNSLDWSTLKMVTASHNYQLILREGNIGTWAFNNINLVDSNTNESLSHGYIVYRIKAKTTLVAGDTIKNTAHIYFDYNLPVATNTERTTIANIVLPVRLITFTAAREGQHNLIQWNSAAEINVGRYEVQRSVNGRGFVTIGLVNAIGNSKYSFTDDTFEKSLNYYRLKMVDKDGRSETSVIRTINNIGSFDAAIYPNPTRNILSIKINSEKKGEVQLKIVDMSGKVLLVKALNVETGILIKDIDVSALKSGNYFTEIVADTTESLVLKFQKL